MTPIPTARPARNSSPAPIATVFSALAQDVRILSARAGNVIGGGDFAADRIVPDAIRAFCRGSAAAGAQPAAVRPWQHVLEPLAGYLHARRKSDDRAAGKASDFDGGYNFGPGPAREQSVEKLLDAIHRRLGARRAAGSATARIIRMRRDCCASTRRKRARRSAGRRCSISTQTAQWTAQWYRAFADKERHAGDDLRSRSTTISASACVSPRPLRKTSPRTTRRHDERLYVAG